VTGDDALMSLARGLAAATFVTTCVTERTSSGIHLVDNHDVGHAQVDLTRVITKLVTGSQRVGHRDGQIGGEEGEVVVAARPTR
jgi:hypothetical protein